MPEKSTQPDSPTVLIADNDSAVSGLLRQILGTRALYCETVLNGKEALARVQQGGVAVLVTDLDMPELDGKGLLAALLELHQQGQLRPTPKVLVISGYLTGSLQEELLANPVVEGVLAKPFDVLAFADQVQGLSGSQPPPASHSQGAS